MLLSCLRDKAKIALFQNYVDLIPPPPPGKTEERKPDPWGNKNVRIPGARPGDCQAWN